MTEAEEVLVSISLIIKKNVYSQADAKIYTRF